MTAPNPPEENDAGLAARQTALRNWQQSLVEEPAVTPLDSVENAEEEAVEDQEHLACNL